MPDRSAGDSGELRLESTQAEEEPERPGHPDDRGRPSWRPAGAQRRADAERRREGERRPQAPEREVDQGIDERPGADVLEGVGNDAGVAHDRRLLGEVAQHPRGSDDRHRLRRDEGGEGGAQPERGRTERAAQTAPAPDAPERGEGRDDQQQRGDLGNEREARGHRRHIEVGAALLLGPARERRDADGCQQRQEHVHRGEARVLEVERTEREQRAGEQPGRRAAQTAAGPDGDRDREQGSEHREGAAEQQRAAEVGRRAGDRRDGLAGAGQQVEGQRAVGEEVGVELAVSQSDPLGGERHGALVRMRRRPLVPVEVRVSQGARATSRTSTAPRAPDRPLPAQDGSHPERGFPRPTLSWLSPMGLRCRF